MQKQQPFDNVNEADAIHWRAWIMWGLAAAFFFSDYFARVSIGVMVADLLTEFQMSTARFGWLTTYFYIPYVLMQIPVGILVDRYGVRTLLISMSLLTGLSCSLFGVANNVWMLEIGRLLLGFGSAFAFVSALKVAADWFPPKKLGFLAGLTQALGMVGAAVGGYPIAVSMGLIGWRPTMHLMAVVFAVLCFFIVAFVFDRKQDSSQSAGSSERANHLLHGLMLVLRSPQAWINALYAGFLFAPTGALAEVWGPSYLSTVQGMDPKMAALANSVVFVGWGFGGPIMGWFSDTIQKRRPVMIASALTGLIIISIVLYVPNLPASVLLILLFLFGISNNGVAIAYAVASELMPRHATGASIAFANMMSVIIGALLLPVISILIDWQGGQIIMDGKSSFVPIALQNSMLVLPLAVLISLLLMVKFKETHCRSVGHAQQ